MELDALKAQRIENLILYMGLGEDDYDTIKLETCYNSALTYLAGAGVHDPVDTDTAPGAFEPGQFDLVLNGLAMFFYDHPDVEDLKDIPLGVRLNLNQMKLSSPGVSL